ncbi:hypothetical protein LTR78_004048 [Recurvomyces mirabilis]|uniref:Pinin/SDK/MemA protein domain-containing protein n=1 Tax=Recurvomyces mirabilis TaxID=574656 RepID=A0AAE0WR55_9PEZI|nr:hypothetical protein LTR78_004048 [Recurvomyces mirabilis]
MSEVTETERPASTNGLKRQYSRDGEDEGEQEQEQEQESKRQRTSPGKNSPKNNVGSVDEEAAVKVSKKAAETEENASEQQQQQQQSQDETPKETRRKAGAMDEKQRSKRLFGSLLGNLNRPSDRASQRRQEIEARRKAELQRQDDERLEEKNRRLERLVEHRRETQITVDKEDTRIRHAQLLNNANFLQTSSEPKLYYRPWDMREEEEDRITQQVRGAKATIARERGEPEPESTPVATSSGGSEAGQTRGQYDDLSGGPDVAANDQLANANAESELPRRDGSMEAEEERSTKGDEPDPSAEVAISQPETDMPVRGDHTDGDQDADSDDKSISLVADQKQADDDGDHVLEGEEDTVIY